MPNLPEAILARIAGHDRAAAIVGDLFEIGASRGRLWFWIAYMRTLIALGWRAPIAFVGGFAGFSLMMSLLGAWMRTPKASIHVASGSVFDKLAFLSTGFLLGRVHANAGLRR